MKHARSVNAANLNTMILEQRARRSYLFRRELRTTQQVQTSTNSSQLDTVISQPLRSLNNLTDGPIGTSQCRESKLHRCLLIRKNLSRKGAKALKKDLSRREFVCSYVDR